MSDAIWQMYKDMGDIRYINSKGEAAWGSRKEYKREFMNKKKLFQYAVILHEFEKVENEEIYKDSKVIIDLKTVMAKSEKELVFKITREIPEEYASNPDNVEIIIRNF